MALAVPEVALEYDQLGSYVLVVGEKNLVQRRGVEMGAREGDQRIISKGLTGDEWVIIGGQLRAFPGKPVQPLTVEEAKQREGQGAKGGSQAPKGKPEK